MLLWAAFPSATHMGQVWWRLSDLIAGEEEDGEFQGSLGYFRRPEPKQTGTKEHHKVKVKGVRGAECSPARKGAKGEELQRSLQG